ncbi:MAG: phenylalanine 4-monooxygenase [Aliiglaciecola sp.]|uniref:phenylalanine 4-monooxygenase n=1 Tax=Aliiglaciecola sp. M165 TaxID=2593649 RepID=UPI00117C992C|nr:phenylalanine 4-monooxygenase [Aliiglaciecola sp. M165]TRY29460.1 phenylalanine 4-monooxygenase [Aliiglaciecola sp. M165]
MSKSTKYVSNPADENGIVSWTEEENKIWQDLIERQLEVIKGRACDEFMHGLELLDLPHNRVPQLHEINQVLGEHTGWQVEQVPSLINFDAFFTLLANKKFPVATFIRSRDDFDYLQEPDIFHEIFGHCPLLTNPAFAHFTHTYGKLGLAASKEDRAYLARLYWFTVEFGLLNTAEGTRIYGGGILSSPGETVYALESDNVIRQTMNPLEALRTPYRIDIMQPVYFTLNRFEQLFELADMDIMALVNTAKKLGLHAPKFAPKNQLAS